MNKSNHWTPDDAADLYHLDRWGLGYFQIDEDGMVIACPNAHSSRGIRIVDVVEHFKTKGINAPMLIRFPGIIQHRITEINRVFGESIAEFNYRGKYRCLYPVKVNQHREVIQSAFDFGKKYGGGLEAGSKAELLAVIAMADNEIPILCNGFKDETVIEMALRASQLGRNITIVIEKPEEVALIAEWSKKLNVEPQLGLRIKLSSRVMGGHWQESSGSKSKFGLTIPELLVAIHELAKASLLKKLHLLHFHPGSQINNVRMIKKSLIEATRVYVDLVKRGIPLDTIDVGGGLAVDYTGQRNRNPSSMNYTLREYTNDVVYYIAQVCDESEVEHPTIFSESGRAMVAHHSMIVVPVIGTSYSSLDRVNPYHDNVETEIAPLKELLEIRQDLRSDNLLESFHDTQGALEIALQMFATGHLTIDQRALAEWLARSIFVKINSLLEHKDFVAPDLETLRFQLADTYFGNFSVFQALPDSWAIDQVFPVMPIHELDKRPTRYGILGDLTCDSDGKVDCFIGDRSQQKWLPLHPLNENKEYLLGIFLVGAYQEALSDDHNLMGKFHIVSIPSNDLSEATLQAGSTLEEVLEHVHHNCESMLSTIGDEISTGIEDGRLTLADGQEALDCYRRVSKKYTYLETTHLDQQRLKQRPDAETPSAVPSGS